MLKRTGAISFSNARTHHMRLFIQKTVELSLSPESDRLANWQATRRWRYFFKNRSASKLNTMTTDPPSPKHHPTVERNYSTAAERSSIAQETRPSNIGVKLSTFRPSKNTCWWRKAVMEIMKRDLQHIESCGQQRMEGRTIIIGAAVGSTSSPFFSQRKIIDKNRELAAATADLSSTRGTAPPHDGPPLLKKKKKKKYVA